MGCFICNGDHRDIDCPKRKALNAVQAKEDGEEPRMGAIRLLNALKGQGAAEAKPPSKELMYVDIQVNGKPTRALVDTGATHNFVSGEEARRLGLRLAKDSSMA